MGCMCVCCVCVMFAMHVECLFWKSEKLKREKNKSKKEEERKGKEKERKEKRGKKRNCAHTKKKKVNTTVEFRNQGLDVDFDFDFEKKKSSFLFRGKKTPIEWICDVNRKRVEGLRRKTTREGGFLISKLYGNHSVCCVRILITLFFNTKLLKSLFTKKREEREERERERERVCVCVCVCAREYVYLHFLCLFTLSKSRTKWFFFLNRDESSLWFFFCRVSCTRLFCCARCACVCWVRVCVCVSVCRTPCFSLSLTHIQHTPWESCRAYSLWLLLSHAAAAVVARRSPVSLATCSRCTKRHCHVLSIV